MAPRMAAAIAAAAAASTAVAASAAVFSIALDAFAALVASAPVQYECCPVSECRCT